MKMLISSLFPDLSHERGEKDAGTFELEWLVAFSSELFNSRFEGIVITDLDARILKVNPAFSRITGYSEDEVLGENPRILKSDRHHADFYRDFWASLIRKGSWEGEIWNRRKSGEVYPEWLRVRALRGASGRPVGYVSSFFDLSEKKTLENELRRYSLQDPLTGLLNKDRFMEQVRIRVERSCTEEGKCALICLDVDRFKQVNESLGHVCGDKLLQLLAGRLKDSLGDEHVLSRFGGDDFCFFVRGGQDSKDVLTAMKRLDGVFKKPFELGKESFFLSGTMGVAICPDDGQDPETLLRKADMALSQAKTKKKGSHLFFSPELEDSYSDRLRIESELRQAILEDQLCPFFQLQVDLQTGDVVGVEALVRWRHPERGLVDPAEFIPMAEETGLIGQIDFRMLQRACQYSMKALRELGHPLPVAVNLSTRSLFSADLESHIEKVLDRTGLSPSFLRLEITESALMEDVDRSLRLFRRLRKRGMELHLDDFGTGYSSLSYLRQFPLNVLKIDQSFIRTIPAEHRGIEIVRAIIGLGHSLGLKVLAEGVEGEEQAEILKEMGCDQAQGYHYSKPLPWEELRSCLENRAAFLQSR